MTSYTLHNANFTSNQWEPSIPLEQIKLDITDLVHRWIWQVEVE